MDSVKENYDVIGTMFKLSVRQLNECLICEQSYWCSLEEGSFLSGDTNGYRIYQ
jgi:hypothetical protein